MKKLKNYKYDNIGCLKATIKNFTVSMYSDITEKNYHNKTYNMWFILDSEKNIYNKYNKLIQTLFNADKLLGYEPETIGCGVFQNGDNSILFVYDLNDDLKNIETQTEYIIISKCTTDKIKEDDFLYSKLKNFLYIEKPIK